MSQKLPKHFDIGLREGLHDMTPPGILMREEPLPVKLVTACCGPTRRNSLH